MAEIHRELPRAEALHYIWWDQTTDPVTTNPSDVKAGHLWRNISTRELKERNAGNSAWDSKGFLLSIAETTAFGRSFVTVDDETALSGGRQLTAGTGISLSETADEIIVHADAPPGEGAGLPGGGTVRQVVMKVSGTDFDAIFQNVAAGFAREDVAAVTSSLTDEQRESVEVALGKSCELYKVEASHNCWVVGYQTAAARTADAGRAIDEDPATASGVCFEFIFDDDSGDTIICQPRPACENHDDPVVEDIYLAVKNLSGGTTAITLTFTRIVTEE